MAGSRSVTNRAGGPVCWPHDHHALLPSVRVRMANLYISQLFVCTCTHIQ